MVLKHRDCEVLRFEWIEPEGVHIISANDSAAAFLPLEMQGVVSDDALWRWLRHRVVPRNRAYVRNFLGIHGLREDDIRGIIMFCRGLSLNDVHWVVADDSTDSWYECNLYDNPFSEVLAFAAFTGGASIVSPDKLTSSPEFTTGGMLAKCWRRENGKVLLYKSGTQGGANTGFEPYSEFYSSQVADALGIPHVAYGLAKFKSYLCSTCELFTSDKVGFIPAGYCFRNGPELPKDFADIFMFDAIIMNTDRHMGNFGYLVDNDTNKICGVAPIFDNGHALFSSGVFRNRNVDDFRDMAALLKFARERLAPSLYGDWLSFPGGVTAEMRDMAKRLVGFRFKRHPHYNLPKERLSLIEDFIQLRVRQLVDNSPDILGTRVAHDIGCTEKNKSKGDVAQKIAFNMRMDPFISRNELAEQIGVSPRTVSNWIARLKADGKIRRVGPDKGGHWEIVD